MMKLRFLAAVMAFFSAGTAWSIPECSRAPRDANFENSPVNIYLSQDQVTEVAFPESTLEGVNPEHPEGLVLSRTRIPSKLTFSTKIDTYHGLVTVHGTSGRTYLMRLLARPGCADSFVKMVKPEAQPAQHSMNVSRAPHNRPKGLIDYLIDNPSEGDIPAPYSLQNFSGTKKSRLVFEQGSVKAYMYQQWTGPKYVGTILEVENTGRTAIRVDIQNIDYSSPTIVQTFGRVREITMNPYDFTLGPAPEYVSDIYGATNRGLIYIVSEKEVNSVR